MWNISSMYLLILVFYLIIGYSNEQVTSDDTTENTIDEDPSITIETTSFEDVDQTSSIETTPIWNPTYMNTNFASLVPTVELTLSSDETNESISTDLTTDQTSPIFTTITASTIYIIINVSTTTTTSPISIVTTSGTSISISTTILTSTRPPTCNSSYYVHLPDGTCISKTDAQIYTVNILRSGTGNTTVLADALSLYISSVTNANISSNPSYILSANEIDDIVGSLTNTTLSLNTNTSFIMVQQPNQNPNITTLGAFYTRDSGGEIIDSSNQNNAYNTNLTVAATIDNQSLVGVTFLNMLIIDKPTTYENIDNSSNKTLASSVIVVKVQRNSSTLTPVNISLYFQVLNEYRPTIDAIYSCSYYDTNSYRWNDSGCSQPRLNTQFNRYECSCNHLSTFALIWSPNITSCNTATQILLPNSTCISKGDAQIEAVNTLRSNSTNSTVIADALSLYISSITNSNTSLNATYNLAIGEIDMYLSTIDNARLIRNTSDSFLVVQPPYQDGIVVLGVSFTHGIGGKVVNSTNKDNVTSSSLSAAALISNESLSDVISLNMLIIDTPSAFRNIDNSTNKTLASSIILASVKRNNSSSTSMNISLYFQVLNEWKPNTTDVDYYCAFYDTNNLQWNESGCTKPRFNTQFNRYECSCNHLTSFALLFLPNVPLTTYLNAQDIASLIFQSISIVCFLFIIIHSIIIRFRNPSMSLRAYDLLPLISCASTTILFIFYIALGMTVYTRTSSKDQKECFLSSSVLMFFVYFFLIFMFCTKTSIGYFNYLRFVRLFPQPSRRKLFIMLTASFFISIAWVGFAAGFNSNSSFKITELYPYKLCWFSRDVIYYFLTIPVCLFLLINIILLILVAVRIIAHARNATVSGQSYKQMKQCVLVLVSSSFSQGIGWLFGPFLTILNSTAGEVLGWFFVVFNGLEGLWAIILYIIIRSQHMDEQKHVIAARELKKPKKGRPHRYNKSSTYNGENDTYVITQESGFNF